MISLGCVLYASLLAVNIRNRQQVSNQRLLSSDNLHENISSDGSNKAVWGSLKKPSDECEAAQLTIILS